MDIDNNIRDQLYALASTLTQEPQTAQKYTDHLAELFGVIMPTAVGVELEEALTKRDMPGAVRALATYYRKKPSPSEPGLCASGRYDKRSADNAVAGIAREVNIDWTFPNGEIDFLFDPTALEGARNHEWLWQFNRHAYWANMARAYTDTQDEVYAVSFRSQLLKWIAQTYIPERWNAPGSAWRTIECGIRLLGSWQISFDGFRRSQSVDDLTLLLMIASMHRQALHLAAHPTTRNWLMMEMNGVYTFSALFPELSDSETDRRLATELLVKELEAQILPDGMHCELSPDYQSVVLSCAKNFYCLASSLGYAGDIPQSFAQALKKTVEAAVLLSTPALTQPRTNDTYTIPTGRFTAMAEQLFGRSPIYDFVNTKRAKGHAPECGATASAFLPYAGFAVMRSDWGADATYLCFDVGPLGCAHVHQDKLNINIYKGSEELLFDDGGGQYEISRTRDYSISGYGHNTVLVDGEAQKRSSPDRSIEPIDAGWITNEAFDHACAVYDDTFGDGKRPASHTRRVRFCKPDFFCVSDKLTSLDGGTHDYQLLFQLDTTKVRAVEQYKNAVISEYGRRYELLMIPLDSDASKVTVDTASAVTEPRLAGWYSGRNESTLHEAITVSRSVKDAVDTTFNTLLFPISPSDALPSVTVDGSRVSVIFKNKEYSFSLDALDK